MKLQKKKRRQDKNSKGSRLSRLRESELQYRLLFQNNPLPMFVIDPKTLRYLAVNQAAIEHYGYAREEFINMTIKDIRPPDELPMLMDEIQKFLKADPGRLFHPGVWKHRTKKGEVIQVEITYSQIQFDGKVAILSLAIDVTEKLSAQAQLEDQRSKMIASSRMSALGEMASGIAHEINTPLSVLYGRTAQLKALCEANRFDSQLFQKTLELMENTSLRISSIIRGLRAFARDGAEDPFLDVSVKSIIDDTLSVCQEKFKYAGIELRVLPFPMEMTLHCRPPQIAQVLLNLLNNAYDALEHQASKWIEISVLKSVENLEIAVTDSGLGIAPEHRDKLFRPFFTTKEIGKGTGLGLSISHGIIADHQGSLFVDTSSPHTRFVICLPMRRHTARTAS